LNAQPIPNKTRSTPSNAQRIRTLLAEGKTPMQIAMILGIKQQYVYVVKHDMKKKAAVKRGPGRPKGSKNQPKVSPTQRMEQTQTEHMGNLLAAVPALNAKKGKKSKGTVITSSAKRVWPAPELCPPSPPIMEHGGLELRSMPAKDGGLMFRWVKARNFWQRVKYVFTGK
jgi:hypothetical protein